VAAHELDYDGVEGPQAAVAFCTTLAGSSVTTRSNELSWARSRVPASRTASAIPKVDHDGPEQLVSHRDAEGEQQVVAHGNALLAVTAAGGQLAACWRPWRKNATASSTEPIVSQVTVAPKGWFQKLSPVAARSSPVGPMYRYGSGTWASPGEAP
jgi:hypothetical protein